MSDEVDVGTLDDEALVAAYEKLDPYSEDAAFLFAEMVTRGLDKGS